MLKLVFGVLLVLAGVGLGWYIGFWVMFVGGIVQAADALKSSPASSWGLAVGLSRIFLSSIIGYIVGMCIVIPGLTLIKRA